MGIEACSAASGQEFTPDLSTPEDLSPSPTTQLMHLPTICQFMCMAAWLKGFPSKATLKSSQPLHDRRPSWHFHSQVFHERAVHGLVADRARCTADWSRNILQDICRVIGQSPMRHRTNKGTPQIADSPTEHASLGAKQSPMARDCQKTPC